MTSNLTVQEFEVERAKRIEKLKKDCFAILAKGSEKIDEDFRRANEKADEDFRRSKEKLDAEHRDMVESTYSKPNNWLFYALWSVVLVAGLILMILTVSTGDLDEIEFSTSYKVVVFIIFVLGMLLSFTSISVIINVCLNRSIRA